jgi:hypothetical protein
LVARNRLGFETPHCNVHVVPRSIEADYIIGDLRKWCAFFLRVILGGSVADLG